MHRGLATRLSFGPGHDRFGEAISLNWRATFGREPPDCAPKSGRSIALRSENVCPIESQLIHLVLAP